MKVFTKSCCSALVAFALISLCSCAVFSTGKGKIPVPPEATIDKAFTVVTDENSGNQARINGILGAYKKAFSHLWENDKALNHDITVVGIDISGIKNLSDAEKQDFLQYISAECGYEIVESTFDALCEKGLIDNENLRFENGVFISFLTTETDDDGFEFAMQKWRSGKGAIFFDDVEVEFEAGFTEIDFGNMAIA